MGKISTEGIVVKVTEDKIVLLCPSGAFKNVARPMSVAPPLLGEQYIHVEKQISWLKYASVAAVFFFAIMSYTIFQMTAPTSSYVLAIDINPSIELVLNEKMEVAKATGYNEEGRELLSILNIEDLVLAEAYQKIITYSYEKGYLTSDNAYVETTIIPLNKVNEQLVVKIEKTIKVSTPEEVVVSVTQNTNELYQDAKEMQVSVNKLSHLKQLENDGVIESVQAAKGKSVSELRKMQNEQKQPEESKKQDKSNQGKGNSNKPEPPGLNKDKGQPSNKPATPAAEKKGNNANQEKPPGKNNSGKGNQPAQENKGSNGNKGNNNEKGNNNSKGNNDKGNNDKGNNDKGKNPGKSNNQGNSNNPNKGPNQSDKGNNNPGKGNNPNKGNN